MIDLPLHLLLINILGHLPTFIWIFYKKPQFEYNYIQVILYLIGTLLIAKIPFWPYYVPRLTFFYVFTFVTFIYFLILFIKYKKSIKNQ